MRKILPVIAMLIAVCIGPLGLLAEDLLDPMAVIASEGRLVLSDGSSLFFFYRDGVFKSDPHGMSGRTIRGTWKQHESGGYQIDGLWSWINGLSPDNDYRKMVIHIGWVSDEVTELELMAHGKVVVHKAYFFIQTLEKLRSAPES